MDGYTDFHLDGGLMDFSLFLFPFFSTLGPRKVGFGGLARFLCHGLLRSLLSFVGPAYCVTCCDA